MMKRTVTVMLLLPLTLALSCGKESETTYSPIPQEVIEPLRLAREECYKRADARAHLPKIDALIESHRDEIAAATTNATDFALDFTDGSISMVNYRLAITTPDLAYRFEEAQPSLFAELRGVFQYTTSNAGASNGLRSECSAGQWVYKNEYRHGGLLGPGDTVYLFEAADGGRMTSAIFHVGEYENDLRYCTNGSCRKIQTQDSPGELTSYYSLADTYFTTDVIREILN